MDEASAKFEAEYCPPLDPALLFSILSDYDLNKESDTADATVLLDQLRESALLEENAEFDPSGTAFEGDVSEEEVRKSSRLEGSATSFRETDMSSVSNGLSGLDLSDSSQDGTRTPDWDPVDFDTMDEETKVTLLLEVFKDQATPHTVRHALQKCNGKWDTAVEELLTQVGIGEFLQSDGGVKISNKGVDAFFEDNGYRKGRKAKGKRKANRISNGSHQTDASSPVENKWQTSGRDVEFVASRTGLSLLSIQSLYNSLGASLPKTITAILKKRSQTISPEDREDPVLVANAYDLQQDFPTIEHEHIFALIHLTHPSTAAAHELAKELTARPRAATGGIQIIPRYAPPVLDDIDSTWKKPLRRSRPTTPIEHHEYDISNGPDHASMYNAARANAFQQAQAAYRKSRSNPLMGGAAAYYSQEGRNLSALSSQATARSADQLAARQSSSTEVDLHGIDVLNGIRIAQERVGQWWASLGENRVNGRVGAESRQAGYRIVVGLGTHSIGGKGKLGPAVSKALRNQGWRIENQGAAILVRGR
ncbi:uncharacterized protein RCC_02372 [Ramularia collo-cygni]|uniref:Smr domain-containing protein n=1 Tax=Ramularia collo-cygni TaxID=112498 RepID=A0A2D3UQH6_9PEZI|nr:uncharacterized protein RCC_02372 [Ramularia collo-cygni]CZT16538.1 uncharacterized protein RCC_02372 [Ramularia collo-cygni]